MSRLTIFILLILAGYVTADSGIIDRILRLQPLVLRQSSKGCPVPIIGHGCPASDEFFYWKCCGNLNNDCCQEMQDWAILTFALLVVFITVCIIVSCLCCIANAFNC